VSELTIMHVGESFVKGMPGEAAQITVVVPTYWTWERGTPPRPDDAIYDHPTPLDEPGTLTRLLESLSAIKQPEFNVVVITAATNPQLEAKARAKVEAIIAPFRDAFPIAQFAAGDLLILRQHMEQLGFGALVPLISLRGYGNVRNIQLIVPHLLGSEVVVALDDDEVVEPDYLAKATEFIGREHGGKRVLGLAGFYLDEEGSLFLPERPPTGNIFLDKSTFMNQATQALQATPGRLVSTPVAYGGNMVFHRSLWERVPFDPYITRGEDIDYLINARLHRLEFFFDKELTIVHLPPEAYNVLPYAKLAQDVIRFIYERAKLLAARERPEFAPLEPQALDPYPGRLLREDVAAQALQALQRTATPQAVASYGSPEEIITEAERRASEAPPRYFEFARVWPRLLEALANDQAMCAG